MPRNKQARKRWRHLNKMGRFDWRTKAQVADFYQVSRNMSNKDMCKLFCNPVPHSNTEQWEALRTEAARVRVKFQLPEPQKTAKTRTATITELPKVQKWGDFEDLVARPDPIVVR